MLYDWFAVLVITEAYLYLCACITQIFGPHENEPLDAAGTVAAFAALAEEVNAYEPQQGKPPKTVDEVRRGSEGLQLMPVASP